MFIEKLIEKRTSSHVAVGGPMSERSQDFETALVQVLPQGGANVSGPGRFCHKIQGFLWAPMYVREAFERVFDRVRRALEADKHDPEEPVIGGEQVIYSRERRGVLLIHLDGSTYRSVRCSRGRGTLNLRLGKMPLPTPDKYIVEKSVTDVRGNVHLSGITRRTNRLLTQADCQGIEDIFERACRIVEGEGPA